MDTRQVLRQLKFLAEQAVWPGDEAVVARVIVVPALPVDWPARPNLPALAIVPTKTDAAGEVAAHRRMRCELHLFADNVADAVGESAMLDAARTPDSSQGAGLARLAAKLRETFAILSASDGIDGFGRIVRGPAFFAAVPAKAGNNGRAARAVFELAVEFVDSPTFPSVANFAASTGSSAGEIDLAWSSPPARFDRVGVHIRRGSGSAPATPADGEAVYTGAGTSFTDSGLSAGAEYFYSAWGTFDADTDAAPLSADTYSDSAVADSANAGT